MSLVRYATRFIALHLPVVWFVGIVWVAVQLRRLARRDVHRAPSSALDPSAPTSRLPHTVLAHQDKQLESQISHFGSQSHVRFVLSPHLDDAALSCGGWIAACNRGDLETSVVTVFAGDGSSDTPLADLARRRWAPFEVGPAVRRVEDISAMQVLGAEYHQLRFPEAAYRIGPPGRHRFPSTDHLFGRENHESALVQPVAEALAESIGPSRRTILVLPLALGNHVDHWIARLAGEYLAETGFPCELSYYEDLPYAVRLDVLRLVGPDWQPLIVPLTPRDIATKLRAIGCYATQVRTAGGIRTIVDLEAYARKLGAGGPAERFWFNPGSPPP